MGSQGARIPRTAPVMMWLELHDSLLRIAISLPAAEQASSSDGAAFLKGVR